MNPSRDQAGEGVYRAERLEDAGQLEYPEHPELGIDPRHLSEQDMLRELRHLHETRTDALFHGSADAFARHTSRTQELESEYLRRHPDRDVDPARLRSGARARAGQPE